MILNSVDLPQPDGPMIETNSPGATENDTSSTAVIEPSRVAKRFETRSTSRRRVALGSALASVIATSGLGCRAIRPRARKTSQLTGRNLDELGELILVERRRGEFELHGVFHDRIETGDLVGIDGSLREEVVARALGHRQIGRASCRERL